MAYPNSYNSSLSSITGSQLVLPSSVYSWSVLVQSGAAFVNGVPLFAGNTIQGGGYGPMKLNGATTLVVGCTGGRTLVSWDS